MTLPRLIGQIEAILAALEKGGPGSGHHGHRGRPGQVGGSLPTDIGAGGPAAGLKAGISIDDKMGDYAETRLRSIEEKAAARFGVSFDGVYATGDMKEVKERLTLMVDQWNPDASEKNRKNAVKTAISQLGSVLGCYVSENTDEGVAGAERLNLLYIDEPELVRTDMMSGEGLFVLAHELGHFVHRRIVGELSSEQSKRYLSGLTGDWWTNHRVFYDTDTALMTSEYFADLFASTLLDMDGVGMGRGFTEMTDRMRSDMASLADLIGEAQGQKERTAEKARPEELVFVHLPSPMGEIVQVPGSSISNLQEHGLFVWGVGQLEKGGPGSGHHGHEGRPGKVGGSLPSDGPMGRSGNEPAEDISIPSLREARTVFRGIESKTLSLSNGFVPETAEGNYEEQNPYGWWPKRITERAASKLDESGFVASGTEMNEDQKRSVVITADAWADEISAWQERTGKSEQEFWDGVPEQTKEAYESLSAMADRLRPVTTFKELPNDHAFDGLTDFEKNLVSYVYSLNNYSFDSAESDVDLDRIIRLNQYWNGGISPRMYEKMSMNWLDKRRDSLSDLSEKDRDHLLWTDLNLVIARDPFPWIPADEGRREWIANVFNQGWRHIPVYDNDNTIEHMEAVAELFGGTPPDRETTRGNLGEFRHYMIGDPDIRSQSKEAVQSMYESTQAQLGGAGFEPGDTVLLIRGMTDKGFSDWNPEGVTRGKTTVQLFPISSWTASSTWVEHFAKNDGYVLGTMVPIERLYASTNTGVPNQREIEWLVLGQNGIDVAILDAKTYFEAEGAVETGGMAALQGMLKEVTDSDPANIDEIQGDWLGEYLRAQGRDRTEQVTKGGPGSGHHGHRGRPGQVGGSAPGTGGVRGPVPGSGGSSLDAIRAANDFQTSDEDRARIVVAMNRFAETTGMRPEGLRVASNYYAYALEIARISAEETDLEDIDEIYERAKADREFLRGLAIEFEAKSTLRGSYFEGHDFLFIAPHVDLTTDEGRGTVWHELGHWLDEKLGFPSEKIEHVYGGYSDGLQGRYPDAALKGEYFADLIAAAVAGRGEGMWRYQTASQGFRHFSYREDLDLQVVMDLIAEAQKSRPTDRTIIVTPAEIISIPAAKLTDDDVTLDEFLLESIGAITKGGPGSGHFGHRGRPGKVGGSVPGTGGISYSPSVGKATRERVERLINRMAVFLGVRPNNIHVTADLDEAVGETFRLLELQHPGLTGMMRDAAKESIREQFDGVLACMIRGMRAENKDERPTLYVDQKALFQLMIKSGSREEGDWVIGHELGHWIESFFEEPIDFSPSSLTPRILGGGREWGGQSRQYRDLMSRMGYRSLEEVDHEYFADLVSFYVNGQPDFFGGGARRMDASDLIIDDANYLAGLIRETVSSKERSAGSLYLVFVPTGNGYDEALWMEQGLAQDREKAGAVVVPPIDISIRKGGPGSGHFGHQGRPGQVGGSQPGTSSSALFRSRMAKNKARLEAFRVAALKANLEAHNELFDVTSDYYHARERFKLLTHQISEGDLELLDIQEEFGSDSPEYEAKDSAIQKLVDEREKIGDEAARLKARQFELEESDKGDFFSLYRKEFGIVGQRWQRQYDVTRDTAYFADRDLDYKVRIINDADRKATTALDFYGSVVRPDLLDWRSECDFYLTDTSRGFYVNQINKAYLNVWHEPETYVHEIGHHWGYQIPQINDLAVSFLLKRASGHKIRPLRELDSSYGADEVFYSGAFPFDGYAGKKYDGFRTTEVVTMGLQHLFTDPLTFAAADPEWFNFTIGLTSGVLLEEE